MTTIRIVFISATNRKREALSTPNLAMSPRKAAEATQETINRMKIERSPLEEKPRTNTIRHNKKMIKLLKMMFTPITK